MFISSLKYVVSIILFALGLVILCPGNLEAVTKVGRVEGVQVYSDDQREYCAVSIFDGSALGSFNVEISEMDTWQLPSGCEPGANGPATGAIDPSRLEVVADIQYFQRIKCNMLLQALRDANLKAIMDIGEGKIWELTIIKEGLGAIDAQQACNSGEETCLVRGAVVSVFSPRPVIPMSTPLMCSAVIDAGNGNYEEVQVIETDVELIGLPSSLVAMYDACTALTAALQSSSPVMIKVNGDGHLNDYFRVTVGTRPIPLIQPPSFIERVWRFIR